MLIRAHQKRFACGYVAFWQGIFEPLADRDRIGVPFGSDLENDRPQIAPWHPGIAGRRHNKRCVTPLLVHRQDFHKEQVSVGP
jgi:hypothetical protein